MTVLEEMAKRRKPLTAEDKAWDKKLQGHIDRGEHHEIRKIWAHEFGGGDTGKKDVRRITKALAAHKPALANAVKAREDVKTGNATMKKQEHDVHYAGAMARLKKTWAAHDAAAAEEGPEIIDAVKAKQLNAKASEASRKRAAPKIDAPTKDPYTRRKPPKPPSLDKKDTPVSKKVGMIKRVFNAIRNKNE